MITDELIADLPDDPEAAFIVFEQAARKYLHDFTNDQNYQGDSVEREYVNVMLAFIHEKRLAIEVEDQPPGDPEAFRQFYDRFISVVDYYKVRLKLKLTNLRREHVAIQSLPEDYKTQIRSHMTAILNIVRDAELTDRKREAIIKKVSALEEEVNRDWSRTEAAVALWMDITNAISQGAVNLDPAIERAERIMKIFAKNKDEADQKRLPAPPEPKRIPGPKPGGRKTKPPDLNDDISF